MRHSVHFLLLSAVLLAGMIPTASYSQTLTAHRNVVPEGYNFWVSTPKNFDSLQADSVPVVLFLHGASLCGTNLDRVRRYGPLHAQAMGRQIPAIIIAPQNPGGAWNPDRINRVVDWSFAHYGGDTNRFYVLGMSLGGYGTIDYSAVYSHRIAAAMALCGGGNPKSYCGLNELPLWILHGTADRAVTVAQSQKVVNAMAKCGDSPRLRFTKLPGVSHGGLARAFYISETYDWLFQHRLDTPDRPVSKEYDITVSRLEDAYKDIDRRANQLVVVDNIPKITKQDLEAYRSGANLATSDSDAAPHKAAASASGSGQVQYHTIRKGDTLGAIARRYGTTVNKLCSLNGISKTTTLRIGRKLKVR